MLDIIFFAAIAAFIGFRLYNVLGHKNFEPGKVANTPAPEAKTGKVVDADFTIITQEEDKDLETKFGKELADKIREISKKDPSFNAENFTSGAKKAFEIILKAFSGGDKESLQPLLSPDVYKSFANEIDKREAQERVEETTLVAVLSATIKNIVLNKKYVKIAVQIVSEQINIIRDKQGKIIEGDPSKVDRIEELWTFGRDISSNNPNWKLLETAPA
jgi:predicted lipid-binding transport protein (Tim44 family)